MNYKLYIEGIENMFYTYSAREVDPYKIGDFVWVTFRNRKKIGLIIKVDDKIKEGYKINKILGIVEESVSYSETMIRLFLWIQNYYLCNFGDILSMARPKNIKTRYRERIYFNQGKIPLNKEEESFLTYIGKKKEAAKSTLVTKFGKKLLDEMMKNNIVVEKKEVIKNKYAQEKSDEKKMEKEGKKSILSKEQQKVKDHIVDSEKPYFLLKGVTGSGKTEVYIELVKDGLKKGGSALFLVPEIALTPQMIKRFQEEFDGLAVLHSKMTGKERADEWSAINRGEKKIVVGVRSAIFAPLKNLKYIIIDEEHETTYKQESQPRYNAKYVAIKRGELEKAKVVLGSATPSIESYYLSKENIFELLEMKKRFGNAKEPELKLIDMKEEKNSFFSEKLLEETTKKLRKGEQVMFLLNRKGYSTYVQCEDCGEAVKCPNCSISLSYYKGEGLYKCNYCDHTEKVEVRCKSCGSKNMKFSGKGTEKALEELEEKFDVPIIRVDRETTKERGRYKKIYDDFLSGKYKIMIGTQMIGKGFHFPNVTMVGILNSDTILNYPDFRAGEKTFQLVNQTAGRSGRGEKNGQVVVQTYQPENYVIKRIMENDYEGFYENEIENRKILNYPPFSRIINIIISSKEENGLEEYSKKILERIKEKNQWESIEIYGPVQAPIYRIDKNYRYQIFIKGPRKEIIRYKKYLNEVVVDEKKEDRKKRYRVIIDVDPINLM